jgi:hypothetical protein
MQSVFGEEVFSLSPAPTLWCPHFFLLQENAMTLFFHKTGPSLCVCVCEWPTDYQTEDWDVVQQ